MGRSWGNPPQEYDTWTIFRHLKAAIHPVESTTCGFSSRHYATKAIIGTIVGTGLVVAGLLSAHRRGEHPAWTIFVLIRVTCAQVWEGFDARLDAVEVALGKLTNVS